MIIVFIIIIQQTQKNQIMLCDHVLLGRVTTYMS